MHEGLVECVHRQAWKTCLVIMDMTYEARMMAPVPNCTKCDSYQMDAWRCFRIHLRAPTCEQDCEASEVSRMSVVILSPSVRRLPSVRLFCLPTCPAML
jgi:hypothetical protein